MRRIFAYLVMMVTMVGVIIFNIQSTLDFKNDAMEFGNATELVYKLDKRDVSNYSGDNYPTTVGEGTLDLADIDIESEVMSRLDDAGVRNAEVEVVQGDIDNQGYELRVTLSPLSTTELNNVKRIISFTGSLSISTIYDDYTMYEERGEFFNTDGDIASLIYQGTDPYPVINVGTATDFETMKEQASQAAENHGEGNTGNTSEDDQLNDTNESNSGNLLYVWMNKTTEDTYEKAFGVDDTPQIQSVHDKVVAILDVSNYDSQNGYITVTSDVDDSAFTISTARALVAALNSEDYGFDITFLYQNSVPAAFGSSALDYTYIAYGITLLVVAILLILIYGVSGVTSTVTMLSSTFISFLLAMLLGFEFSVAALAGLIVVIALSVFLSANYFNHVKKEILNGKSLEKANREGYHKSFFLSLDVAIISLVVSLFGFLLATGSFQTFFGVIMIGTIVTFLVTNYLNKWATYWLTKDSNKDMIPFFALFKKKEKEEKKEPYAFLKKGKKNILMLMIGGFSIALLAISLPLTYYFAPGQNPTFFNNSGAFEDGYTLTISYRMDSQSYSQLETTENFLQYIVNIGLDRPDDFTDDTYEAISSEDNIEATNPYNFIYYPETASVNVVEAIDEDETTYYMTYFSVDVDRNLTDMELASGRTTTNLIEETILNGSVEVDDVFIHPGSDSHFVYDSLTVGSYLVTPTNINHTYENFFLLTFIISIFAAIYALVRHGILVSLTELVGGSAYAALLVGLLSATRIPFNSFSAFGIMISLIFVLFAIFALVSGNKDILKERKLRRTDNNDIRLEIANNVAKANVPAVLLTLASTFVLSLSFFGISSSLYSLSLITIVSLALSLLFIFFVILPLYYFFACHINFKKLHNYMEKRKEKNAAEKKEKVQNTGIVYVDDDMPHETIIPGLNEFRR